MEALQTMYTPKEYAFAGIRTDVAKNVHHLISERNVINGVQGHTTVCGMFVSDDTGHKLVNINTNLTDNVVCKGCSMIGRRKLGFAKLS